MSHIAFVRHGQANTRARDEVRRYARKPVTALNTAPGILTETGALPDCVAVLAPGPGRVKSVSLGALPT